MTDEEIIKRQLLIDGDGMGDDRRLNVLLKLFVKWCNLKNESPTEIKLMQEKLLLQLLQCKYMYTKSQCMSRVSKAELKSCSQLSTDIEQQINDANLVIERSKEELENAKILRKHRSEYDIISNVIQKHPARKETNAKLVQLNKELSALQETKHEIDKKLEIRRKHFHVLVASLNQLQTMLIEENELTIEDFHIDISDEEMESKFDNSSMIVD